MTNKEKARAYFTAVNAYDEETVRSMVEENYIQHNPLVPTGRAAFLSLLPKLKQHGSKIQNLRIIEDGAFVAMHHHWKNAFPFGKEEMVAFHVIRFDSEGLIAEHWNVSTLPTPPNSSGRLLTDGETAIRDGVETEQNRGRAIELFQSWIRQEPETFLKSHYHPDFHQHHSELGDGVSALLTALKLGAMRLNYRRQHKVLAEGNFVLSISEGTYNGIPSALYDLLRFEKGLVVEQWPLYQPLPEGKLMNNNTLFNF